MIPPVPTYIQADQVENLASELFARLDNHIVMAIPIGIGKPLVLVNTLYNLAKTNPKLKLDIHTGLTLSVPKLKTDLEHRLLDPFFARQFDKVLELDYVDDLNKGTIPENIQIIEFYFKAGERLKTPSAQQNFFSSNYTHVARDIIHRGINLFALWVAPPQTSDSNLYSLSSNPDVTLDLHQMMRALSAKDGQPRLAIAEVQSALPYMPNDAEVADNFFDYIVQADALNGDIFATPHQSISIADHMIGFYASSLVKDAGTLQIGIGSLGDAVVNALTVRHKEPHAYQALIKATNLHQRHPNIKAIGGTDPFDVGLYGNTEMLVPGYFSLKDAGILKRMVYDDIAIQSMINQGLDASSITLKWLDNLESINAIPATLNQTALSYLQHWGILNDRVKLADDKLIIENQTYTNNIKDISTRQALENYGLGLRIHHERLLHAGFFVGTKEFYQRLHQLPTQERNQINMTSVSFTNQLLGDEALKIAQRSHARFINASMKMTILGAAISDALANGKVVSGVGGQYNFVAMAHDLPEARSILMTRSVRHKGNKVVSNIVFNYGHTTIPQHLRDIVVTEYGIADLRGKTDYQIIDAMLRITDSRFQKDLIKQAKKASKLPKSYKLPESAKNNTPENLSDIITPFRKQFSQFPFGNELTQTELTIAIALKGIVRQLDRKWPILWSLISRSSPEKVERCRPYLDRMNLREVSNLKQWVYRKLLLSELK